MEEEQRFAFDAVADLYDRARPRYPKLLTDDLISLSDIAPNGRVLEVGCGTGQATLPFARRGFRMLCVEPGAALARVARMRLAGVSGVEVVQHTFEAWPLEPEAFSLVMAAGSFHWVAPEVRFTKAAAALHTGGTLAVFGNVVVSELSLLRKALDDVYTRHAPSLAGPPTMRWYAAEGPIPQLFADSHCFGAVISRRFPWSQRYTSTAYLDLLATHSDHLLLPSQQREALLRGVREVIDIHGGSIDVRYEAHLYLAHRTG